MKNNIIISLDSLESNIFISILDEIILNHKIPEIITEDIRQELFSELDTVKILNKLKEKFIIEKSSQSENEDVEKIYMVKLTESDIYHLRVGTCKGIETVIYQILSQVDKQN